MVDFFVEGSLASSKKVMVPFLLEVFKVSGGILSVLAHLSVTGRSALPTSCLVYQSRVHSHEGQDKALPRTKVLGGEPSRLVDMRPLFSSGTVAEPWICPVPNPLRFRWPSP